MACLSQGPIRHVRSVGENSSKNRAAGNAGLNCLTSDLARNLKRGEISEIGGF